MTAREAAHGRRASARPAQACVSAGPRDAHRPLPQARQRGHAAAHVRGDEGPADRGLGDRDAARADDGPAHLRQEGRRVPGAARRRRNARRRAVARLERAGRFHRHVPRRGDAEPVQYYSKLPTDLDDRDAIVLDPMLATGHSSAAAVEAVKEAGAQSVTLVCIVAAPPGHRAHPRATSRRAHRVRRGRPRARKRGFIVPGLGDAGDRLYGTK